MIHNLARRDFNRIDVFGLSISLSLAQHSLWWLLLLLPTLLLSVAVERAAAQGVKP